jgi:hypothetical protein
MFFRRAGHLYNDKFGSANGNRIGSLLVKSGRRWAESRLKQGFPLDAGSPMGTNGCHRRQPFGNRAWVATPTLTWSKTATRTWPVGSVAPEKLL